LVDKSELDGPRPSPRWLSLLVGESPCRVQRIVSSAKMNRLDSRAVRPHSHGARRACDGGVVRGDGACARAKKRSTVEDDRLTTLLTRRVSRRDGADGRCTVASSRSRRLRLALCSTAWSGERKTTAKRSRRSTDRAAMFRAAASRRKLGRRDAAAGGQPARADGGHFRRARGS